MPSQSQMTSLHCGQDTLMALSTDCGLPMTIFWQLGQRVFLVFILMSFVAPETGDIILSVRKNIISRLRRRLQVRERAGYITSLYTGESCFGASFGARNLRLNHQDRQLRNSQDAVGDTSQYQSLYAGASVRGNDSEVDIVLFGKFDQ